jgi:peptidoglycan/xylan/chitin deacetylase (PgdA/CDA1 family)
MEPTLAARVTAGALLLALAGCDVNTASPDDAMNDDDTGSYGFNDHHPASTEPPGNLDPSVVPMFVAIGWDDNGDVSGMQWSLDLFASHENPAGSGNAATHDGAPTRTSYYNTSSYAFATGHLWKQAWEQGHEIGNHTQSHSAHLQTAEDAATWNNEIDDCMSALTDLGIPRAEIRGFRTPFLGTHDATLQAVRDAGITYDCSLEEGYQLDNDGTSFLWPYTLDEGSPGNELLVSWGTKAPIEAKPGLWEMPAYAVIVPPDELCEQYGVEPGFRDRMKAAQDYFDTEGGKITGFDYNLWFEFEMTPAEVSATLKYTLDQRLAGNRAPFLLGAHTDEYDDANAERRAAIEDFLDYALSKPEVRVVRVDAVLEWMRDPEAL